MIPIPLTDHDRQQLEHTCKPAADRRLRARCQAILRADRGRRHPQIADDLRVTPRPLPRWRNASRLRGLAGLTIRWASGRAPRLPETLVAAIVAWVKHGPAGCGLARAHGTAADLAPSLSQTQGIAVRERTMRAWCTNHGIRPYRPTSQDRKGAPAQQDVARQELAAFKKSRSP